MFLTDIYLSNTQSNGGGSKFGVSCNRHFNRLYNFVKTRGCGSCDQGREKSTIIVAGKDKITHEHIWCLKCNKNGNFANKCSHKHETNTTSNN